MDCYSAESEFIESLDFLSPPVKRLHTSREFGSVYNTEANDVHLLRGFRNKFARRTSSSTKNIKPIIKNSSDSSTSLVLKKTSERQILEHYSIVSYTSLQHPDNETPSVLKSERSPNPVEKPLIKVTVIPKTDQIQTAKLLRRRRYVPKKIQSTTSNHENSVQTKNVYLIVAGRRREKIYEIKTTGSAKLSSDHDSYIRDDDIPIKELSNFKHLIQSLNMDRNKKKEKKEKKALMDNSDAPQQTSVEWRYPSCQDCLCGDESNESPKKSRVKIFGQFGISEDEKYVLRYGATINDKQVLSDVAQLTRDFSPIIATTSYGTTDAQSTMQKDSCIQADYNVSYDKPPIVEEEPSYSKESHGTQVNFNVQCNVAMTKARSSSFSDKKVQCSCSFGPTNKSDQNTLKDCHSPLVIISVYPKSSPEDTVQSVNSPDTIRSSSPTRMATYTSNQLTKTEKNPKRGAIESKKRSPAASRSPSPAKKVLEESVRTQVSEKKSPDRQRALRAIKEKIQEKDKLLKHDPSPRKPPSKFNTANSTQVAKNLQNITVSNATQVSKKNPLHALSNATQVSNKNNQVYQASNGTQVSVRKRQTYTVSNATQYSDGPQSMASNGTQFVDNNITDSIPEIAPVKHSRNVVATPSLKYPKKPSPIRFPRTTQVSNATQVPKSPQFFASNGTQVSEREPYTGSKSNGTQISKKQQYPFSSRARNQETYTVPNASQVYEDDEYSRITTNRINEMGTNTEHVRKKRTLIETYTKQLTDQMSQKDSIPARFDNSKVTINIDGDGEYYDVLFNHDKRSTDVTIRKTLKDMGSQKYDEEQDCSVSLENFMYVPEIIVEKEESKGQNDSQSKSLSIYNNPSDDEFPLDTQVSRLTIRDSLEISHRREDRGIHNNLKNTQTCFTAQIATTLPDATEFLAPIKHFIGDDCSITDPVERDKQIRQLLGVDKLKQSFTGSQQARYSDNSSRIPYQCIYRKECKNSELTEINFEFQKVLPCFKSRHTKNRASVSVQCRQPSVPKKPSKSYYSVVDTCEKCCESPRHIPLSVPCDDRVSGISLRTVRRPKEDRSCKSFGRDKSAIYQQLILNRNIQVFLQVDQFSKQKPIILSRKQYDKVKKTIQKTISVKKSSHDKRKCIPVKREKNETCLERASSEISLKVKAKNSKRHKPFTKRTQCTGFGKGKSRHGSSEMYSRREDPVCCKHEKPEVYDRYERPEFDRYDRPEMYGRRERPMPYGKLESPEVYGRYEKFGDPDKYGIRDRSAVVDRHEKPEDREENEMARKPEKPSGKRRESSKREKSDKQPDKPEVSRKREGSVTSKKSNRLEESESHEKHEVSRKRHKSPSSGKREKSPKSSKTKKSASSGKRGKLCKRGKSRSPDKAEKSDSSDKNEGPDDLDEGDELKGPVKRQKSDVSIGEVRTKKPKEKAVKKSQHKGSKHEKSAQVEVKCSLDNCKKYTDERLWGHLPKSKQSKKDKKKADSCDKKRKPKKSGNVEVYKIDHYDENSRFAAGDDESRYNKKHDNNNKGVWTVEHTSTPIIQQRHAECFTNMDIGTGRDEVNSSTTEQVEDPDRLSEQRSPSIYARSNDCQEQSLGEFECNDSMDIEHQETEMKTFVLFNAENTNDDIKDGDYDTRTRKTVSSVEIRYASVAYMKQVAYSSTDVGALSNSSIAHVKSFHTIFRGHRKSATPNLGTSAYSLYSEEGYNSENKSVKYIIEPRDSKPKRPFLRRLMSCLVMRSARDSELKLPTGPVLEDPPSVNSSIDSYHISTSLGAVEISSSIYDTSASFYSNHTILPVNSKIKRGFFSSVRGFLTNRKS
ncbi:uncharacterized protein LOC111360367 [Spodoptera litura]|uniref:Uncharacterized protein LOC111360367 n=1 Tax=Spodoptera litura TaxID=69820 RepID=A0A9J7EPE5_SPOLT|nr:uncharacterized protein LOC111360367 [Spodoptera litura]